MFRRLKAVRREAAKRSRSGSRRRADGCCWYCNPLNLTRLIGDDGNRHDAKRERKRASIQDSMESNDFSRECAWGGICKWQCQREDVGLGHCDERGPQ